MYVDGFVLVIPKKNLAAYRKDAQLGARLWMKHGALDYKECMADDIKPKGISFTFPKMAKTKGNEIVFFSYIAYKSRTHRDQVNKKVMSDPAMNDPKQKNRSMPFDMKRFAYGGFKVFVGV
ncbi:DUF1428 domain-containing protein [Acetobacteraceae bacterium]|nr:DUF1428 domain-containing protein [Candidatus Parcubacteria bacterium]